MKKLSISLVILMSIMTTACVAPSQKEGDSERFTQIELDAQQALIIEIRNDIQLSEQRFLIGETVEAKKFLDNAEAKILELEKSHSDNEELQRLRTELNLYKGAF